MSTFKTTFQSKKGAARCGVLRSRGKQLSTPCVFLDTQCGLPTFLTTQQSSKANLPKHGYVIDLGNIYYLSSTEQIHSSFSQKRKKDKNKNKNKTPNKSETETKDYTTNSVLNEFYSSKANTNNNRNNSNNNNMDHTASIHSFLGMKEHMILLDHQSAIHREPQQGSDKCVVLVTDHGKKKISIEEYVHHVKNINPDLYIIPSENILSNASKSRCQKNVNRTLKLFNNAVNHHLDLNIDSRSIMIPVIEGGCDMRQRHDCCNEMMNKLRVKFNERKISYGFMMGGVGFSESPKQKQEILETVIKTLNDDTINGDKLRIINGIRTLDDVLLAVSMGCDVIVSSYATELTQNGVAIVHAIAPQEDEKEIDEDDDIDIDANTNNTNDKLHMDHINIRDICYSEDPSPILRGCKCYACSNHSRAYIRHLFNVNEMNAYILLQMHNSYRFLHFVENIKQYVKEDKLSQFCDWWMEYQSTLI